MKINIKFTNTEVDDNLKKYAEKKVSSFEKLIKHEEQEASFCYIEFSRSTHHQKGDVFTAEVTLEVAGKIYRSTKNEPKFKKAIDKVKDDILQALRVEKQKNEHKFKKGAREVKKIIKGEI